MQTFIVDHYIEQGINQRLDQRQHLGEATALLRLIERQMDRSFGPPSDSVRERVLAADSDTLLERLDRILVAKSVEAVLHRRRLAVPSSSSGTYVNCPWNSEKGSDPFFHSACRLSSASAT
jgi:hypothetical protein